MYARAIAAVVTQAVPVNEPVDMSVLINDRTFVTIQTGNQPHTAVIGAIQATICNEIDVITCVVSVNASIPAGRRQLQQDLGVQITRTFIFSEATVDELGAPLGPRIDGIQDATVTSAQKLSISASVEVQREASSAASQVDDTLLDGLSISVAIDDAIGHEDCVLLQAIARFPPPPPPPPPSVPPLSPPPPSPPPPPIPPPVPLSPLSPPPCAFNVHSLVLGASTANWYSLVVLEDATVSSHTHDGPFAIGGRLTDGTPQQSGSVSGHSSVGSIDSAHLFEFSAGVTVGPGNFPFQWSQFEHVARVVSPTRSGASRVVHVRCFGGRVTMLDLDLHSSSGMNGRNLLVVFNTFDTVVIDGDQDGRPFSGSILAPFSRVVVLPGARYIDGIVIARSLEMNRNAGSLQMHAHGFSGSLQCSTGVDACQATNPDASSCRDSLGSRKCARKALKGKCRKRRVHSRKCQRTCNGCAPGRG